jgi:hypothetical protein
MIDKTEIKRKINSELDKAEKIWNDVKGEFLVKSVRAFAALNESVEPSNIPGFPFIKNGEGKVGNFSAMILDIRNSTKHLLEAYSNKKNVSQLQRVLYETTAINTLGLICVNEQNGAITEFLGDGFLALFETEEPEAVYKVRDCAEKCLEYTKDVINPILKERYDLPDINIGIGIAYSKAIVTLIGMEDELHPKAIGECIYRASKLSKGNNEILYDEKIKLYWPSSKGGKLSFIERYHRNEKDTKGFITLYK